MENVKCVTTQFTIEGLGAEHEKGMPLHFMRT